MQSHALACKKKLFAREPIENGRIEKKKIVLQNRVRTFRTHRKIAIIASTFILTLIQNELIK